MKLEEFMRGVLEQEENDGKEEQEEVEVDKVEKSIEEYDREITAKLA